jgi:diaminopropionate ammonia-lyase
MEIPAWVIEGYSTIFSEIEDQIGRAPDVVMIQAGVGGLAAAVARHFRQDGRSNRPAIVCVQPVVADGLIESVTSEGGEARPAKGNLETIMSGLSCAMPSLAAWPILRSTATMFLSIEDRFAVEAVRRLYHPAAGDPRVVAGEAGAAGLAGLLALMREPVFAAAKEKLRLAENACVLLINSEVDTDPVNFRKIIDGQSGL